MRNYPVFCPSCCCTTTRRHVLQCPQRDSDSLAPNVAPPDDVPPEGTLWTWDTHLLQWVARDAVIMTGRYSSGSWDTGTSK